MLARNLENRSSNRLSVANDLFKIQWVRTFAVPNLTQKSQFLICFIVTNILMFRSGGIRAPLAAICAAWTRAGLGSIGISTMRGAIRELEEKGYVRRQQCRIGENRQGIIMRFNLDRFSYWTKIRPGNVVSSPTSPTITYLDPYRQNVATSPRTKTDSRVNICNTNNNSNYARARENDRYNLLARNPVLLTLWVLLRGSPDLSIFNRAETEIRALEQEKSIENHSGVPWEQYEPRKWREMIPQTRDSFATTQIVPRLRGESPPEPIYPRCLVEPESEPTPEDIATLRRYREEGLPNAPALPMLSASSAPYPEIDDTDPTMKFLIETRNRTRARRIDGV